jgi:hypothetical protein
MQKTPWIELNPRNVTPGCVLLRRRPEFPAGEPDLAGRGPRDARGAHTCRFEEETRLEVGSPGLGGVLALVRPPPMLVFGAGGAWQSGGVVEASREE